VVIVVLALIMKGFKAWVLQGSIANLNMSPLHYNKELLAEGFQINGENPV